MFFKKKEDSTDTRPKKKKTPRKPKEKSKEKKTTPKKSKEKASRKRAPRQKKKRGGNNASQARLLLALNLPFIEPRIVLDEIKNFADNNDGLVREIEDKYTVLILSNDQLEGSEIEENDELGMLSLAIRGDKIRSATRVGDLRAGNLVVIPNAETISVMDEYDSLRHVKFKWGLFSIKNENGEEDEDGQGSSVVCNGTVTLNELLSMSSNKVETIDVHGSDDTNNDNDGNENVVVDEDVILDEDGPINQIVTDDGELDEIPVDANKPSNDNQLSLDADNDNPMPSVEEMDVYQDFEIPDVDIDDMPQMDTPNNDGVGIANLSYEEMSLFEDDVFQMPDVAVTDETPTVAGNEEALRKVVKADEYVATLQTLQDQIVDDTDLQLVIVSDSFNELFIDGKQPFRFPLADETLDNNDSTLARSINERRNNYNAILAQRREINMQQLSQMYIERVNEAISKVQFAFDDRSPNTEAGRTRNWIEGKLNADLDNLSKMVDNQEKKLDDEYREKKLAYVEAARAQAEREYDEKYLPGYNRRKDGVYAGFVSKFNTDYHTRLYELTSKRQKVAQQTLQSMKAGIIAQLQMIYQRMVRDEEKLRNDMNDDLQKFLQTNFTDETLRANALQLRLQQESEADRVRSEYKERFDEQSRRIAAMQEEANRGVAEAQRNYSNMLSQFKAEHELALKEKQMQAEAKELVINDLRSKVNELQNEILDVSTRKETEADVKYKNQLLQANDTIEAQKSMLQKVDEEKHKMSKRNIGTLIATGVSAFALAFGIMGFTTFTQKSDVPADNSTRIQYTQQVPTQTSDSSASADEKGEDLDAYVANGVNKDDGSLIVAYQEKYKKGESVEVVGTMSKSNEVKKAKVIDINGDEVTVQIKDKSKYTFVLSN